MTRVTLRSRWWQTWFAVILALSIIALPAAARAQTGDKVSQPGDYRGYSAPIYSDWVRTSQYVTVRDGTRIAVDIMRPAVDGVPVSDPLPLVWTHHRYHRAHQDEDGRIYSIVDSVPALRVLLRHGYIVAAADVRGGGSSFGTRRGPFTPEEANDAYDLTEWFASQPWCDGNIGMYGLSYLGITQYMAAGTQPPSLKAIFPQMAMFDLYSFIYPGGVFREDFVLSWGAKVSLLDKAAPTVPVDEDTDGSLLRQAVAEHRENGSVYWLAVERPYRDSQNGNDIRLYQDWSPSSQVQAINESGIAIYHLGGWYDMYPLDALLWFANLTVPQKLVMTPWSHNGSGQFGLLDEHLRWFDYWLKGIDNGIMDEPPIYYYVMGAPAGQRWRFTDQWPLPDQQLTPFYLSAGPSGSVDSTNDGLLLTEAPADDAQDVYTVDYTTTTGPTTRWTDGYGGGFGYPDMTANDEKGLTYTTPPLAEDTEITGHPVVTLWITTGAEDASFFVYLEEVDAQGRSTYITEGMLRGSHRALSDAPWNNLGLPYHSGNQADVQPLPANTPTELVFDLYPTSNVFDAGHRIRMTITGADQDNYETIRVSPPPSFQVLRGPAHPSRIVLPVIPASG